MWLIRYGLNQIGIKIDMYRQEHRFSPATPIFEGVNNFVSMEFEFS